MFTITPLYQVTLVLVAIACILHTKEPEKQEQVLLTPKLGEAIRIIITLYFCRNAYCFHISRICFCTYCSNRAYDNFLLRSHSP